MQKSDEKKILGTVLKKLQPVGTFWDCPEFSRNKQNQKGITLITLIITIIVMLILVGVTINVALNGGLFEKAETATKQTQLETDKETVYLEAIAAYNEKTGQLDTTELEISLRNLGWKDISTGDPFICTSPKGNILKITLENRSIKIEEYKKEDNKDNTGSDSTILYGEKYILEGESEVYIIFKEDGKLEGTAPPNNTTYELKVEEGKNLLYASIGGTQAVSYGVFNEDFTKLTTNQGQVFSIVKELEFYGVEYSNTIGNFYFYKEGIALFYENGRKIWNIWNYTESENQLTIDGTILATVSEGYNDVTIDGIGTFTRNDNTSVNWNKEYAPAFISISYRNYVNDCYPDLSNNKFQEKGEYKTTIVLADGKYSVADYEVSFKLTGGVTLKEYKEGEDYSYNSSTGEIIVFNLTEPVLMNIPMVTTK